MQYKIVYKPGFDNRVVDALSRRAHNATECFSISMSTPQWTQAIMDGYYEDPDAKTMIAKLVVDGDFVPDFSFQDGLLRFKGRIWLENNSPVQQAIMQAMHSSAIGGHSGFPVTYHHIKHLFAWPVMRKAIHSFVTTCSVCQ